MINHGNYSTNLLNVLCQSISVTYLPSIQITCIQHHSNITFINNDQVTSLFNSTSWLGLTIFKIFVSLLSDSLICQNIELKQVILPIFFWILSFQRFGNVSTYATMFRYLNINLVMNSSLHRFRTTIIGRFPHFHGKFHS